ncbi:hypothetical protein [uncultured Microbulbifer sp.]|uniref:hypothetical protein n=1 Tax=uncultured Microbulbifer sp. TaxID=348147 RepID=UPI0025FA1FD5|nr:hypothetical protein [uncultured Microbulbifer sp.]
MTTLVGRKFHGVMAIALAAVVGFASSADAKDYVIDKGEFGGSFITSNFKYNQENRTVSTIATGDAGGGGLGQFQSHTVSDLGNTGVACESTTTDNIGGNFVVERTDVVMTFKKGQIFLKAASDQQDQILGCLFSTSNNTGPDATGVIAGFDLEVDYHVVGGTGEYAGATGIITIVTTGSMIQFNSLTEGDSMFGGVTGTLKGNFCTDCP